MLKHFLIVMLTFAAHVAHADEPNSKDVFYREAPTLNPNDPGKVTGKLVDVTTIDGAADIRCAAENDDSATSNISLGRNANFDSHRIELRFGPCDVVDASGETLDTVYRAKHYYDVDTQTIIPFGKTKSDTSKKMLQFKKSKAKPIESMGTPSTVGALRDEDCCKKSGKLTNFIKEQTPTVKKVIPNYGKESGVDLYFKEKCVTAPEKDKGGSVCSSEDYEMYITEYKKYLMAASQSFDLPYELLACLGFQESGWNDMARSKTNARGLFQLTAGAIRAVNQTISDSTNLYDVCTNNDLKCQAAQSIVKEDSKYKTQWIEYFQTLLKDPTYPMEYRNIGIPKKVSSDLKYFKYPPVNVALGSIYLGTDSKRALPESIRNDKKDHIQISQLIVGIFNAGPGSTAYFKPSSNPKNWVNEYLASVKKLYSTGATNSSISSICANLHVPNGAACGEAKYKETKGHIEKITTCLEHADD